MTSILKITLKYKYQLQSIFGYKCVHLDIYHYKNSYSIPSLLHLYVMKHQNASISTITLH
jgi:hypothetical protein